jgi:acetyl-CoA carboxylase biotin carboxylase subunit
MAEPRTRASQGVSTERKRHALVLGWRGIAERIASDLGSLGFSTTIESEWPASQRFPRPSAPDAVEEARQALKKFAAQAPKGAELFLHPGVSRWAELPVLQTLGQESQISVIGPPVRALSFFSNRLNLLAEAEKSAIANLVSEFQPVHSAREIHKLMRSKGLRFPILLKSSRGGGAGRYVAREPEDLERRLELWIEQVRRNAGEVIVFPERYLEGARYVVQPFARLVDGHFEVFPAYDASLQSRYRKILSFCPCTTVDPPVLGKIREWSERLAAQCGFVGVGCFEFMVDGTRPYLVEGAARLDTNFHLWETVAGTRAVEWQLAAQEGKKGGPHLLGTPSVAAGISVRILAEESLLQLPQPGRVHELGQQREWKFPGAEASLSLSVSEGEEIGHEDSGLAGVLWVFGRDATQALTAARGIMEEIWIAGSLQTNERFLTELLNHPWVRAGLFHAGFVDEEFLPAIRPPEEIAKLLARLGPLAVEGQSVPARHTQRWSLGDQWVKPSGEIEWAEGPEIFPSSGSRGVSGKAKLPDGRTVRVCLFPNGEGRWLGRVGSWSMSLRRVLVPDSAKQRGKPRVAALVPGRVHSILFREGSVIPAHEPFLILESLGMLVPHALPKEIRVNKWNVSAEDIVRLGEDLADFDVV